MRAVTLLRKNNIPTVQILDTFKVPSIKRDIVVYQPLNGPSLRDLIKEKNLQPVLDFASFFADLHNQGIYFRAIHFNNVIVPSMRTFGLIDVTDLYFFSSSPLSIDKRIRNFKHMLHYREDRQALATVTIEQFLDRYVKNAIFRSKKEGEKFIKKASRLCAEKLEQ